MWSRGCNSVKMVPMHSAEENCKYKGYVRQDREQSVIGPRRSGNGTISITIPSTCSSTRPEFIRVKTQCCAQETAPNGDQLWEGLGQRKVTERQMYANMMADYNRDRNDWDNKKLEEIRKATWGRFAAQSTISPVRFSR